MLPLAPETGDPSPLGRLYELDALVLLLGVTHLNNTSLHLAEERATWDGKRSRPHGAPILVDGVRRWVVWDDLDGDDEDFETIGDAFAASGREHAGSVGAGTGRLFRRREVVDFAVDLDDGQSPIVDDAVEELLRFDTTAQFSGRNTTGPIEVPLTSRSERGSGPVAIPSFAWRC